MGTITSFQPKVEVAPSSLYTGESSLFTHPQLPQPSTHSTPAPPQPQPYPTPPPTAQGSRSLALATVREAVRGKEETPGCFRIRGPHAISQAGRTPRDGGAGCRRGGGLPLPRPLSFLLQVQGPGVISRTRQGGSFPLPTWLTLFQRLAKLFAWPCSQAVISNSSSSKGDHVWRAD